ncbi:MAG: PAS domain S-box protein [Melioribacteraceae bacterium]
MLALYSFGAETSMPQYLLALIDSLALSIAASIVVIYWVANPMNRYYQERLQNAETLHRKEEHHKVVVESIFKFIPEGVLVLTESLNLLKHNKAFEEIVQKYAPPLGYAEQELTENIVEQCRTKIEHGDSKEIYIPSKDQSRTDLSQSDKLILEFNTARMFLAEEEEEEEEARIVVSLLDITERKQAETRLQNSEQRYRNIIQTSMDGFWIADTEGRILDVNAAYCQLIGYEREELLNMRIPDVEVKETLEETAQHIQEVMTKGYDRFETRHRRKDGQLLDIEVSAVYQLDNEDGKFFIFLRDTTERKRAENELKESEERFRSVAQSANEAIITADSTGKIVDWNRGAEKIFGYSEAEITGKNLTIIIPQNYVEKNISGMKRIAQGGEHHVIGKTVELYGLHKSGRELPLELSLAQWEASSGKFFTGIIRDITERKHSEVELIKLSRAVEQSPASVIITNPAGDIEYVNNKFCEVTGYTREEVIGKNPRILKSGYQDQQFYKELWDTIISGNEWHGEFHDKKKNGELYFESGHISPIVNKEGKVTHFVAVKEDITERKRAEKELIEAKEKAEQSNKLKDTFIANMSHEIRTPLNGILGMTSLIKDIYAQHIKEEDEELFYGIDDSSKRIIRTVDMILNYSRLQTGELPVSPEAIELSSICERLVREFQTATKSKSLELLLENRCKDSTILADEYSVTQSISNLIDNAIKYTKKGFVKVILYKNGSDEIMLDVKDSGIGMTKEYIDHIFEPYSQEEMGYGRAYEGVGLGLSLVKKFMDLNNAVISVESKKGEGTTFTVNFGKIVQFVKEKTGSEKIANVVETQETKKDRLVLLVEDDSINQETIKRFIENSYNTLITDSSDEAIEILRKNKIDIILMDISIKGSRNGLELTKELKASKEYSHIAVIAVTAHASDKDRQNALEAGCDDYISKPFTKESLLDMIAKFV